MPRTARDLFQSLDAFAKRIPLAELQAWMQATRVEYSEATPYLRFHADHYVRNLMYQGRAFQALVLCWRNGQRSPIHDHTGSSCAVHVLKGAATETLFDRAPNGMIYPLGSRTLEEGRMCASQDNDIHQMSNLQAHGAELVTLHVYSPPLLFMNMYNLLDVSAARFFDPVNDEFVDGGGI
jgi:cysteine dioxygenase